MAKFKYDPNSKNNFNDYNDFIESMNDSEDKDAISVVYELYDDVPEEADGGYEGDDIDAYDDNDSDNYREEVSYKQHRANGFERFVYFVARAFVWAICLTTILFIFIFKAMTVSGNSMSPAICENDYIIVNKLDKSPAFGDIAVILNETGNRRPTVKRIVATEGQVVSINYEKNTVSVNGKAVLSDLYRNIDIEPLGSVTYPVKVPKGCYFVLGDNLTNSLDSRSTTVGMVKKENILGTVVLCYRQGENIKFMDDTPIDTPVMEIAADTWDKIVEAIGNLTKGAK